MATDKNFVQLDFQKLKDSLKEFLKSQSTFSDYDFDGSNLSVLLDLLTYNTQYNAFYMNMIANDMFLDSAVLRESIVSRAKHLGYTPNSVKSAVAKVNIEVIPSFGPGDTAPSSLEIDETIQFYATVDNKKYYFYPTSSYVIIPDVNGQYLATEVELKEGLKLTHKWTVDLTQPIKQKYIIPNATVDTDTLVVTVQTSSTNPDIISFTKHDNITELDPESTVYFLQESADKKYELKFGDGIIGKALANGNILSVTYQVSSGILANGIKTFIPASPISGYQRYTITTTQSAKGGLDRESDESIKFLAPLNYASQHRAVTKEDYETLIKKDIPTAEFVRVWGGEDNDPVQYGKIFIAIKPFNDYAFPEEQKASLIDTIIKKRNIISLAVEIVEPDYLEIVPNIKLSYKSKNTSLSEASLRTLVLAAIDDFVAQELAGFDADFKYSKFISAIDDADSSITKNATSILLKYKLYPTFNSSKKYEIFIHNELDKGDAANNISSIYSDPFTYRGLTTYFGDDGKGSIYLYRLVGSTKTVIQEDIGTVDYTDGKIILNAFNIQGIPGGLTYLSVYAKPASNDISTMRNQILLLEDVTLAIEDISRK